MAFKGYACSKFILGGEHAVVHGAHAVAIPLFSKTLELDLSAKPKTHSLTLSGNQKSESIAGVLTDLKTLTPNHLMGANDHFHASGTCGIPVGAGLGASAALCVGLARAHENWINSASEEDQGDNKGEKTSSSPFSKPFAKPFAKQRVQKLAHELEKRFHGSPSGIDTSVIAYEQPILFQKDEGVRFAASEFAMPRFVLIDSGIRSSTKHMVRKAQPHFSGSKGQRLIRRFDLVTTDAWKALQQGDLQALTETMKENHSLMREIDVVGDLCDQIVAKVCELGAIAAKVTGAGSGGFILGVLPSDREQAALALRAIQGQFGFDSVVDTDRQTHDTRNNEQQVKTGARHANQNSL